MAEFVSRWLLDHGFEIYRQTTGARGATKVIEIILSELAQLQAPSLEDRRHCSIAASLGSLGLHRDG